MTYISSPSWGRIQVGGNHDDIAPPPQPSPIEEERASTEGMEGDP
jgi:hypothetical protein